ncbi:MAG: hypothetical protein U9R72_16470 [Chloroflexota bacterium]|nr:hypothetical protein [Chloroflexota bacterium]
MTGMQRQAGPCSGVSGDGLTVRQRQSLNLGSGHVELLWDAPTVFGEDDLGAPPQIRDRIVEGRAGKDDGFASAGTGPHRRRWSTRGIVGQGPATTVDLCARPQLRIGCALVLPQQRS